MKELIKKILNEQLGSQTGAKVCAVICDPKPNQTPVGEHCDGWFIKICHTWNTGCQTPEVGDYMVSHSNMGMTSWKITRIEEYGTVTDYRMRYPTCEYVSEGCTDPQACNFSQGYTQSCSNCCIYEGCNDPNADNYSPGLWCGGGCCCDDTTGNGYPDCCTYTILGCTNPGAVNYNPQANTDDGSCTAPTTYSCSDGQCHLDVNGPHATLGECLVECSDCTHNECWYCPGPIQTKAPDDFLQHELSEKVQTTSTKQGCKVAGSQWLQILTSGTNLHATKADCETAESDCSSDDDTTPVQTEQCHCCQTIAGGGTSPYVVVGPNGNPPSVAVGKCDVFEQGSSYTPTGVPNPTTIFFTSGLSDCRPITQPLPCEETIVTGTSALKKGENKEKDREKMTSDIKEDIRKMKRIIK